MTGKDKQEKMNNTSMRRSRRKQQASLLTNIVFCLITLVVLTGCIFLLLQNYSLKSETRETMGRVQELEELSQKYIYSQADMDAYLSEASTLARQEEKEALLGELKQKMTAGESTVSVLRGLFPEDVVVYADNGYSFFPVSETLKKHSYVYEKFQIQNNGEIVYIDDVQQIFSAKGIDVSRHQGTIDWKRVAGDQIAYAFIRAGFRGSTEGKIMEDEYFEDNIEGALDHDIDVGVYFYTQAITEEEAVEEAEFVLDLLEPYDVTYPVVFDLEEVTGDAARTDNMTREEHTKAAIAFCETIKKAGYTPMIYGNLKTFMIMLDMEQIEEYDKWFAYYDAPVYFPYEFAIWQYTSKGSVEGVGSDVDLNVCMKDYTR